MLPQYPDSTHEGLYRRGRRRSVRQNGRTGWRWASGHADRAGAGREAKRAELGIGRRQSNRAAVGRERVVHAAGDKSLGGGSDRRAWLLSSDVDTFHIVQSHPSF
jgi:hypothetical protein